MSEKTAQTLPGTLIRESEPTAGSAAVPMWLMVLPVLVLFGGAMYFDLHGAWFNPVVHAPYTSLTQIEVLQPGRANDPTIRGKIVFEQVCALCHGVDGAGKPAMAPPFVGSEWVMTENAGQLIRIPLHGLQGPITVKGQEWNLAMAAMGASLNDEDLAAVLSYMRNAWGNEASLITPEQVREVRDATQGRTQPWTVTELKAIP